MTDAGESTNTTHGNSDVTVQAHSVGRDLNVYGSPPRSSWLLRVTAPPLASTPSSHTGSSAAATSAAAAQPPAVEQPTTVQLDGDGPGYLLPSNNDQKAIDFYDNEFHDAVIWGRHPPGTDPSYQPSWVREFAEPGVFRLRNAQVNRCLEPVSDAVRGDHVVANVCSSGKQSQLWRAQHLAVHHELHGRPGPALARCTLKAPLPRGKGAFSVNLLRE